MHTEGPGIWRKNWKSRKMRNTHFRTWNMAMVKTEKVENLEMSTVGRNMARKLKIMENEKHPLDEFENDEITKNTWKMRNAIPKDLEYGEKTENHGKWEIIHFRTEIWRRKTEKGGKFRNVHCRTGIWQENWKIMENEKHPLDDFEMTKSLKNAEKWEMHTEGPGIWRKKLKITENEKYTL